MKRLGLFLFGLFLAHLCIANVTITSADVYKLFQNPTNEYRPFVRWWWNGNKVEEQELLRELKLLHEAGIGGVEINPIAFPGDKDSTDKKSLIWLSDEWIDLVGKVTDEAKKKDITCDLLVGSGWPWGSETTPRDKTASIMLTYTMEFEGGLPFDISRFHLLSTIDPKVSISCPGRTAELISLKLAPDSILDANQIKDITSQLQGDILHLDLPKGKYVLYALVRYDSFASVINGAPGASGPILNHFDASAIQTFLDNMASAIEKRLGPLSLRLRAMFVDSMELEGMNWSSDFSYEFEKRRGYKVESWLPFIMFKVGRLGNVESFDYGAKKGDTYQEKINRVRFDFELTKAELLHERYTNTFLTWCHDKNIKSRAQAYGNGFFLLESSLGYDIPECESWTTNWLRHRIGEEMSDEDYRRGRSYTMINKYVTSAAHLTGKRLISAEEMTNTYRVFNTSLEFLKVGSDMNATTGVTHSVWHGFNYSPADEPFPGWIRYGSYYNENNPWWPYFRLLNDYRARMSSLLQNADMVTDIAILPPIYDMWTTMGAQNEPFPVKLNVNYTSLLWEAIHKNGGGADYITEKIIEEAYVKNGKLCYGPKQYGNIFIVETEGMMQETADKLLSFVQSGGRVFCIGSYPSKSLGLKDYFHRDSMIVATIEQLKSYPDKFILLEKPQDNKYLEWYTEIMKKYNLPHDVTIEKPDRFLLQTHFRMDNKDDIFLLVNVNMSKSQNTNIIFPKEIYKGKTAWLYDAGNGNRYRLPMENGQISITIGPSESWIVVLNKLSKGTEYHAMPNSSVSQRCLEHWNVTLSHSHEKWTADTIMDTLIDLRNTQYDKFMGTIEYSTIMHVNADSIPQYINLGKVCEICQLFVNGHDCGIKWYGERVYDIASYVHEGNNEIRVNVTTMMGNYLQSMPENRVVKRFLVSKNTPLVPSGLLGPVNVW